MQQLNQWINWRSEPRPNEPKPAKVPVNLTTDARIDAQAPENWISYDEAVNFDDKFIGFVLTAADPYFCIDLDHCLIEGKWSELAEQTCTAFNGAYVEISHSGDGLHIIGRGTPPPGFKTRGNGIELYSHSRFIAITGNNATGDVETDHTAALGNFCQQYLEFNLTAVPAGQEWTTAPIPEATPIESDEELIKRMITARSSAAVAFGGKASANHLWTANEAVLAATWPSSTDAYDRSSADAALAAHLAFWTGKDCERIRRLMNLSALKRDKWERRGDDYLKRTILGAAAATSKVYTGPPQKSETAAEKQDIRHGYQFLDVSQMQTYFAGCVFIVKGRRVLTPRGILTPEEFKSFYSKFEFQIATDNPRPTTDAFKAFTECRAYTFPWADSVCFRPERETGALIPQNNRILVNTYIPPGIEKTYGSIDPFLHLLSRMIPDAKDREIMLCYMASIAQNPGKKFQWCPLVQGIQGNGKSAIARILTYMVGSEYTHNLNAKELGDSGSKFTGWLMNKLLIAVEEIHISQRRDIIDALKPLITNDRVEIQPKGQDQFTYDNRANFFLTSNHRDAILKTRDDRRYAIFYTAQQTVSDLQRDGFTDEYFAGFYNWLNSEGYSNIAGHFERYQIPVQLDPAKLLQRAPDTTSTELAIRESLGRIEQEILNAIDEQRPGFKNDWISSVKLTELFHEIRRSVAPKKRAELLETIGYIPHPALSRGLSTQVIFQEAGKRPVLYVRKDSLAMNFTNPSEVTAAYSQAQGYTGEMMASGGS